MRFTLIFLFLTNCLQIKAQNWVGTNLVSWMNIHHPYVPLEYNQLITRKIRLNMSAAAILPVSIWDGGRKHFPTLGKHHVRGYRLSLEPQFYFPNSERMYIGFDFNMTNYQYASERGDTVLPQVTHRYRVWTQTRGINCMFGRVVIHQKDRLAMIWSSGLGMRFMRVRNDLPIPVDQLSPIFRLNTVIEPEEDGIYTKLYITFNFKIIVLLGKLSEFQSL